MTKTFTLDTGLSRFEINGVPLLINPTDAKWVSKLCAFQTRVSEIADGELPGGEFDMEKAARLAEISAGIEREFAELLNGFDVETCLGGASLLSLDGEGNYLLETFLDIVTSLVEDALEQRKEKMQSKVQLAKKSQRNRKDRK